MESKELMIGDWVKYSDSHSFQIEVIDRKAVQGHADDGEYRYGLIEPIPITTEILGKNGFVQQPFSLDSNALTNDFCKNLPNLQVCVELDKYEPRFMVFHRDYKADDELDGTPTYCMVATWVLPLGESVHELQRALRCCGLWDLAENFKI